MKEQRRVESNGWGQTPTVQYKGLDEEYVFWNSTPKKYPSASGWQDALRVIAAHPTLQPTMNNRNLWRRATDEVEIASQWVKRQP